MININGLNYKEGQSPLYHYRPEVGSMESCSACHKVVCDIANPPGHHCEYCGSLFCAFCLHHTQLEIDHSTGKLFAITAPHVCPSCACSEEENMKRITTYILRNVDTQARRVESYTPLGAAMLLVQAAMDSAKRELRNVEAMERIQVEENMPATRVRHWLDGVLTNVHRWQDNCWKAREQVDAVLLDSRQENKKANQISRIAQYEYEQVKSIVTRIEEIAFQIEDGMAA